jgi:hypothetical protein
MPRTQKHINTANSVRIYINIKQTTHTNLAIKEPLFSSNKGAGDFSAAFHWCKKADLMTAGEKEVDRGGPLEMLQLEKRDLM